MVSMCVVLIMETIRLSCRRRTYRVRFLLSALTAEDVKMETFIPEQGSTENGSTSGDEGDFEQGDQFGRVSLCFDIALSVAKMLQPGYQLINGICFTDPSCLSGTAKTEAGRYVCVSDEKQHGMSKRSLSFLLANQPSYLGS